MTQWSTFRAFLRYRKQALSKHGVHSPFVFELVTKVFPENKEDDFSEHPAEDWRTECMTNNTLIHVDDFGTGVSGPRKISEIARRAAKRRKPGQLLYRIIRYFQPQTMLEMGASLGISTLYAATASPGVQLITLEGSPAIAAKAAEIFKRHELNIDVRTGEFETTLLPALQTLNSVDCIYFDGNHREKPTLHYFETALPFAHANTVFIFDDIHWSPGMESAWEKIKSHPKTRLTIDVFHFGLVFFREEQKEREHFVLRY